MAKLMKSDFLVALTQLAAERNLPREIVLSAIEAALVSAYRKDSMMNGQNISVILDPATGEVSVFVVKTVVEEVEDPQQEITLAEAARITTEVEIGDTVRTETLSHKGGRIAAQTAKQVVMQRLREAERELVYDEFAEKEGEVFSVTVQRTEPQQIIVELGRAEAILPYSEQAPAERYRVGQKLKVLLQSVRRSARGPELIVSRTDNKLLFRLFEMEVPEIYNGAVEIMAIAREAGARSKVAVFARQEGVDPVGSCVGLRGIRIQNIVNELHGEKIDVVQWHKDPAVFVANALSPSQVLNVKIDSESNSATAVVPDRQLSLAIGKEGQNARLAARLTGLSVDIRSHLESEPEAATEVAEPEEAVAAEPAEAPVAAQEPVEAEAAVEEVAVEEVAAEEEVEEADVTEAAAEVEEVVAAVEEEEAEEKLEAGPVEEPEQAVQPDQVDAQAGPDDEVPAEIPPELFDLEEPVTEPELVPALDLAPTLAEVPDQIWSLRRAQAPPEPGQIRFAEDIVGLKGGVMARRGRKADSSVVGRSRNKKRKSRAGRGGRRTYQ